MIGVLDEYLPERITKTTLYHIVRWGLRIYIVSLLVIGAYSLLWVAELAGIIPEAWLSTIWIAIAAMGTVFLVLLIPLFYTTRSTKR
ncbi:hypothetical protein ACFO5R_04595 [Halosolutus amylolyticus]|uniref:Uncharacterized protein n=1 Tax=Halosolutus amylolyticus TaxID=2932267 RepID=A0ABD5PLA8_9EURY|nr:hypothetical protein [Halosolutus amylolyticus]